MLAGLAATAVCVLVLLSLVLTDATIVMVFVMAPLLQVFANAAATAVFALAL